MTYLVAYAAIDTTNLFAPSTYFNSDVQDIGTLYEFRSHIATQSLDVVGLGMNDLSSALVESINLFVGTAISGPSSEQSLSWQAAGLHRSYANLFNTTFAPEKFGSVLLAGDDILQGSADADFLHAFSGNDTVLGGGGADAIDGGRGNDILTGGGSNDRFYFDSPLRAANADHITDFRSGLDQIWLDASIFKQLPSGPVDAGNFTVGTQPLDSNDYLIYNPATGVLSYDADGSGSGHAMVAVLTLNHHPTLAASDIVDFVA